LAEAIANKGGNTAHLLAGLDEAPGAVAALTQAGDLVVTLGAGSVGSLGPRLLDALEARG
jgi:UDP-N-acetylmuramate--alanine ligase